MVLCILTFTFLEDGKTKDSDRIAPYEQAQKAVSAPVELATNARKGQAVHLTGGMPG
jgi:hypothetical protein